MTRKFKLTPVVMVTPTTESIYAPTNLASPIEVSESEFEAMATTAHDIQVSFNPDGKSDPENTTVYYADPVKLAGRYFAQMIIPDTT